MVIAPLLRGESPGLHAEAFDAGAQIVTYQVDHMCVVRPVREGLLAAGVPAEVVTMIDNYHQVWCTTTGETRRARLCLNDELFQNLRYSVRIEVVNWGQTPCWAAVFRHTWQIKVRRATE